jgi:hypothetical protein
MFMHNREQMQVTTAGITCCTNFATDDERIEPNFYTGDRDRMREP